MSTTGNEHVTDWIQFEDVEPPTDRTILFFGRWIPFDILKGGEPFYAVVRWSSLSTNKEDHQWFIDGVFTPLNRLNVKFTHWAELADEPEDS